MTIPAAELDLSGHDGHLSATQQAAFDQLKRDVEAQLAGSEHRRWYDDTTLLRFLRARSFSAPKALKQFLATDKWRSEASVDDVYHAFPVAEMEAARAYYPRWTGRRDRLGRPLYVYRIGSLSKERQKEIYSKTEERRYQSIITLTELLIQFVLPLCTRIPSASSPTPISCVTTIIDLSDISLGAIWSLRSHLTQSMSLSSAYYPETLSTIAVVNAPSFFPTIWSWVKLAFDEGTRRKIHVLGGEPGPTLREIIKAEDLPRIYGGELEWKFEDEPLLDAEVQAVVGQETLPSGPLAWEGSRVEPVGSGRGAVV